jgi:hypothetical protein
MIKALWNEKKIFSGPYPLVGPRLSGQAPFVVDLKKQGVVDTIDTLSIHLGGNIVTGAGALGTATGAENPQGLMVLATLQTAPLAAGLIPINGISSRAAVMEYAIAEGAFDTLGAIVNAASSTIPIDVWLHFRFKRPGIKKGIDYAHPTDRWTSDLLTIVFGTVDQLYSGAATTWDLTGVTVDVYGDLDVNANPDQIHAVEIFEQQFNITAANGAFQINTLPTGCFYDELMIVAELNGALSDAIVYNIEIESGGRYWLNLGETNADFVRQRWTKQAFYDPNGGAHGLTGLYLIPLRDGLWSRAIDAVGTQLVLKLGVNAPGAGQTFNVRVIGRKLVPGGIKKTIKGAQGTKTVTGLPVVTP